MDVTWGEDYEVLAEVARAVFDRYSPLSGRGRAVDLREQVRQFVELDWLHLGDPVSVAQDTAALGSIAAIFVESGRALVQSPLLALTVVRDTALLAATASAIELAAGIAQGKKSVAAVFPDPAWRDTTPVVHQGRLTGAVLAVPYAEEADGFLVLAQQDGEAVLLLVEATDAVDVEPQPNLGEYPLAAVSFSGAEAGAVLARGADAERSVSLAQQRATVLLAAQIHGAGTRLLEMSVEYAKHRHQFGGPIGRFQAVQYLCTDIAVATHLTSVLARNAATTLDRGENASAHVALMRKQARRTAQQMVHAAHEVHAGMGFMVECDIQLFTKAARYWQFALGTDAADDQAIVGALDESAPGGQS
jgi:alkylation response protein AidB-like acyl-CoA dehydrogenase